MSHAIVFSFFLFQASRLVIIPLRFTFVHCRRALENERKKIIISQSQMVISMGNHVTVLESGESETAEQTGTIKVSNPLKHLIFFTDLELIVISQAKLLVGYFNCLQLNCIVC